MKRVRKNSGLALIIVILVMVLLMVTGVGIQTVGYQARAYQMHTESKILARSAADAGLAEAIDQMTTLKAAGTLDDNLPTATNIPLEGNNSDYSYTVTKNASLYTVTVTGQCNGHQHTIQTTISASGSFDFAIFSKGDIIMRNSAEIDWYNNSVGDSPLKVGTNSTDKGAVDLKNSIKINGDVVVGEGGDPSQVVKEGKSIEITGDISAQSSNTDLSPVTVPSYLLSAASQGKIKNNETITSSGKYDEIDLGNSEELTVSGSVELYITGDIDLGNSSKIELDDSNPNSSLTIYLNGDLELKNSAEINNKTETPSKFKIFGTENCSELDFKNGATMHSVILAPEADITFHNSIDYYGMIAGKALELKNSAKIYYDVSLREESFSESELTITRWQE